MMSTARDMGVRYLELDHSEIGEARGGLGAVQEHEICTPRTEGQAPELVLGLTDLHGL